MFKLDFPIEASPTKIELTDQIYLSGSCFSDEIGHKLLESKFQAISNPFGVIYNPLSILRTVSGNINPDNVIESQGIWYHWDFHGSISALSKLELLEEAKQRIENGRKQSDEANWIILTFGTAFTYRAKATGDIVANCHKVQTDQFEKELLSVKAIIDAFEQTYASLSSKQSIILTVSPVRHVRDGLEQNNLSKSVLLQAVHELVNRFENVQYFPAYEIMVDELRDYRFSADDMVHPSPQAVNYIWQRFAETYFSEETQNFLSSWGHIKRALDHRPFQPQSKKHQDFLYKTMQRLSELEDKIDVSTELAIIKDRLVKDQQE